MQFIFYNCVFVMTLATLKLSGLLEPLGFLKLSAYLAISAGYAITAWIAARHSPEEARAYAFFATAYMSLAILDFQPIFYLPDLFIEDPQPVYAAL